MDKREVVDIGKLENAAEIIRPDIRFEDLDLPRDTVACLEDICQRFRDLQQARLSLSRDRSATIDRGPVALFAGASGTGKTLAANWLATKLGAPLYRVDLAAITSKYIGETEKNLAKLLSRAEQEEVVLLFDEADSLFGKRTGVRDTHDRHDNIDTAGILQRIESCSGVVILATNLRTPLDEDLLRRLRDLVKIDFP